MLPLNSPRPSRCCPHPSCSRPTAVNLSIAATALKALAEQEAGKQGASAASVTEAVVAACEQMLRDDVAANKVSMSLCWVLKLG